MTRALGATRQPESPATASHRYGHVALILGLTVVGIAGAYFAALYLVAH